MKKVTLFIIVTLYSSFAPAQEKNSSLHLELLGKSIWFGSVTYEREFNPHLSYGFGLGYKSFYTGGYSSSNGEGTYYDLYTTTPLYFLYQFFNTKQHLLTMAGVTMQHEIGFVHYFSGKNKPSYRPYLVPFIGIAYELEKDRFVFRLPLYLSWIGESDWFPALMPWAGISFGYKL